MRVQGYVRVSTEEQGRSGAGLEAQRLAIAAECDRRGWTLLGILEDRGSAKNLRRPAVREALAGLKAGEADALVVAKLDRLSRSMLDFATILAASQKQGWSLVALDAAVDTTTPQGEAMAHMTITFAQLERRLIGERTKAAMAVKKAQGARFGRRSQIPAAVRMRIVRERDGGRTLRAIAAGLNDGGVATGQGGREWYASSVSAVLASDAG